MKGAGDMAEKKDLLKGKKINEETLEQVSGGNDALPADQLEHTEKNVEIIVDHTVLPDVVTDTLPVRGRF